MTEPTRDSERAALVAEVGECCMGSDPYCMGLEGCLVVKALNKRGVRTQPRIGKKVQAMSEPAPTPEHEATAARIVEEAWLECYGHAPLLPGDDDELEIWTRRIAAALAQEAQRVREEETENIAWWLEMRGCSCLGRGEDCDNEDDSPHEEACPMACAAALRHGGGRAG